MHAAPARPSASLVTGSVGATITAILYVVARGDIAGCAPRRKKTCMGCDALRLPRLGVAHLRDLDVAHPYVDSFAFVLQRDVRVGCLPAFIIALDALPHRGRHLFVRDRIDMNECRRLAL